MEIRFEDGDQAECFLKQVAAQSYGSKAREGVKGGLGSIGMFNGKPAKFNTHWWERAGKATDEMIRRSNQLRESLGAAAKAIYDEGLFDDFRLRRINEALGLDESGSAEGNKTLLSRQVVAQVLDKIDEMRNKPMFQPEKNLSFFDGVKPRAMSSKGIDMTYAAVKGRMDDNKGLRYWIGKGLGIELNEEEKSCLIACIERDLDRRRARGLPVPDNDAILARLTDHTHPALMATLLRFQRNSEAFREKHPDMKRLDDMALAAVYLSGAPEEQVEDRLDLMTLLADTKNSELLQDQVFTMALVSEKLPEMRRLQPSGPLTLSTVWKACFGKRVPRALAKASGETVASGFLNELTSLIKQKRRKAKGPIVESLRKDADAEIISLLCVKASTYCQVGLSFTAAVDKAISELYPEEKWSFVPSRDMVADSPLYNVEDAQAHTDGDICNQLIGDLPRQNMTVTFRREQDSSTKTLFINGPLMEMSPEKIGSSAKGLMDAVADLVGNSPDRAAQRKVTLFGLCQPGLSPMLYFLGVGHEHDDVDIEVVERFDGSISISYSTKADAPTRMVFGYDVEMDGSNRRAGEFVCEPNRQVQ